MKKERFDHTAIEQTAQEKWEALKLYETDLTDSEKEPYYLLFEFPYPSGDLHIGHWYAFALTDIFARFKRMQGKSVLFPMGFDSFGLPAENAAIKYGKSPEAWTLQNMETMRAQVRSMGTSLDWSKEVMTSDPSYYKWTQWLFTKLYEHDLAYRKEAAVKWCPKDQTVLANEQVNDGKCERCGTEVEERNLTQWFLAISKYAERLLTDLEPLPWREEIKEAQRAWIGKSEGAKLSFTLSFSTYPEHNDWRDADGNPARIEVFTTRPDTVFGATYIVLAPEHPWVRAVWDTEDDDVVSNKEQVAAYVAETAKKSERERLENKEKTGVRLEGVMAVNPATKEEIPVYIADYVLASYGTGAVMAVPAHDERDFAFAKTYNLPMRQVVVPCGVDVNNPPQEGFEEVRRETVIVHLKDRSTGKFALLNWHGTLEGITTAIMGGIEEGQTPEIAALAEIAEEVGLDTARIVHQASWITAAKYCASHKKQNRTAHAYAFLAEVDDLSSQKDIASSEQALHTLEWVDESKVLARLTPEHQKQVWQLLRNSEDVITSDGYLINSGLFDGRDNREAMQEIVESINGEMVTNYRMRDWSVGRQRYWGCPIPMVYDPEGNAHPVPQEHLPWLVPTDVEFTPTGKSPNASSKELHERVTRIFGEGWTPEYDTLDAFVDSSWYFLRYLDPKDEHDFSDQGLLKKWLPVNRYSGGSEHTTMHLLYSRFFHKALYDLALVPTPEPFNERMNRGLILGPDGAKMSKSKGNVINPDAVVAEHGADAVRMYLAFIGPYNEPGNYPWNLDGVGAMRKFLDRVYSLKEKVGDEALTETEKNLLAKAVEKTTTDTERFKFNTAISALMVLVRGLESSPLVSREAYCALLVLLAPYAPHLAEHLWSEVRTEEDSESVHQAAWPEVLETAVSSVTLGVQVNGKRRGEITISPEASEEEAVEAAKAVPEVLRAIGEGEVRKVVYVPGRILNLMAS